MKFFDLFCGVGGFRLGMERNGNVCIGSCEIEKYARQTYAKNFGHEPEYRDARDINPSELPGFDVLCAGFPCQAFSLAGKKRGFEDTRGTLIYEIIRIAREKQPSFLFLENVKGLLYHDKGNTFKTILNALDEVGYDVTWQVINSKYFVPQSRERLYIIGYFRGKTRQKVFCAYDPIEDQDDRKANKSQESVSATLTTKQDRYPNAGFVKVVKAVSSNALTRENPRQNGRKIKEEGEPSFTITCIDKGAIQVDGEYRFFTPIECERLQGFPDNWTEGVSDAQRFKQMGNAVTVDVIEHIARFLNA